MLKEDISKSEVRGSSDQDHETIDDQKNVSVKRVDRKIPRITPKKVVCVYGNLKVLGVSDWENRCQRSPGMVL